jgi:hypothetical protein
MLFVALIAGKSIPERRLELSAAAIGLRFVHENVDSSAPYWLQIPSRTYQPFQVRPSAMDGIWTVLPSGLKLLRGLVS